MLPPPAIAWLGSVLLAVFTGRGGEEAGTGTGSGSGPNKPEKIDFDPAATCMLRAAAYTRDGRTMVEVRQTDGARVESASNWEDLLENPPAGFDRYRLSDGTGEVLVRPNTIVRIEKARFAPVDGDGDVVDLVLPHGLRIRVDRAPR